MPTNLPSRDEVLATSQALLAGPCAGLFLVTSPLGDKQGINLAKLHSVAIDIVTSLDAHYANQNPE